jgi:predicted 2-oxoglutarate/Fe(II)-dependent dioxygenase YbiX
MISICNDFVKANDIEKLLRLIGNAKPTDLNHADYNHKYLNPSKILDENIDSEIFAIVDSYIGSIHHQVNTQFSINVYEEPHYSITVYSEGESLSPHFDGMEDDHFKQKTPNGHESRDMSSVLYLNDDYLGGLLRFPHLNLSIKPPAGCLVIFPSSEKYTHLVERVEKGFRYIVPQFWCIK